MRRAPPVGAGATEIQDGLPTVASALVVRSPHGCTFTVANGSDLLAKLRLLGVVEWDPDGALRVSTVGFSSLGLFFAGSFGEFVVSCEAWRGAWDRLGANLGLRLSAESAIAELLFFRFYGRVANSNRRKHIRGPGRRVGPRRHAIDAAYLLHRYFGRSQREAVAEAVEWVEGETGHRFNVADEAAIRKAVERACREAASLQSRLDAVRTLGPA